MTTYREHRNIIAVLVLIWVAMCGGALSATGKIDADLHKASQWLSGKTVNASQAVQPGVELEIVFHRGVRQYAPCTRGGISGSLATDSVRPAKLLLPELTYYL